MLLDGSDLSLIYDLGTKHETSAVRNVNITLDRGEFVGIIGPSGSGKSSLLYLLSGLKTPTSGTVFYQNTDLDSLEERERSELRRKHFGFVFQRHFLIDYMTVYENILLASNEENAKEAKESINSLLRKLHMEELASKRPSQLSGGQRQKTAIARALINKPDIIFADEPTAFLDHENAREVMNILEANRENTTVAVVTHDKSILYPADRVIELWDGYIRR